MPSNSSDATYSIADLARLTGVNVRTIRYYLAQGLLPASGESGPGAHYGEGHLNRLRLTRRLQQQHLPLAEIRRRLAELTDAQAAELLAASEVDAGSAPQSSALEYVRSLLVPPPGGGRAAEQPVAYGRPAPSRPPFASESRTSIPLAASMSPGLRRAQASMPRMRDVPPPNGPSERSSGAFPPNPESHALTAPTEPPAQERSQWERLSLGPNIEIHIRRPLSRIEQRRVERLITIARQVLKEDKP